MDWELSALRQRCGRLGIGNQHHLRGLRAALDDYLQIASKPEMRLIRIARDSRFDERAAHDARDAVDQRMLHAAARNMHHSMSAELEQPELRRADPPANREARTMPKIEGRAGHDRRLRQVVTPG